MFSVGTRVTCVVVFWLLFLEGKTGVQRIHGRSHLNGCLHGSETYVSTRLRGDLCGFSKDQRISQVTSFYVSPFLTSQCCRVAQSLMIR